MNELVEEGPDWWARWSDRFQDIGPELWNATLETLYMVSVSTVLSLALGFVLAFFMILTHRHGLRPRQSVYHMLDVMVNMGRSFPFIILLIAIIPFTRLVAGTTIGSTAAIVPLTIAAMPFAARILEGSLLEVDPGVVEAARSFGAGDLQIFFRVMLPEALPSIALNVAVLAITLLNYSAMTGTVGGGGLGDLAVNYGYRRFESDVMFSAVVILIIMVQIMQSASGWLYRRLR